MQLCLAGCSTASLPIVLLPQTNANNPTQDGWEEPSRLTHPPACHVLDVVQLSCSGGLGEQAPKMLLFPP